MPRGKTARAGGRLIVAIDGPAGVGKSTLARSLAIELELPYVNTGLMYRALAEKALRAGMRADDGPSLAKLAESIRFSSGRVDGSPSSEEGGPPQGSGVPELLIDGEPASPALSRPAVETTVSEVAGHPEVRQIMRREQRKLGIGGCVMEGRDIGTVVFPDADVKIFLWASHDVRVGRRKRERPDERGVGESVARRDARDSITNPLMPAPDAHQVDTTGLSPEEVLSAARDVIRTAGV